MKLIQTLMLWLYLIILHPANSINGEKTEPRLHVSLLELILEARIQASQEKDGMSDLRISNKSIDVTQ